MYYLQDLDTGRSKGYGFVDMESPEAVNTIMSNVPHHINKFRVRSRLVNIDIYIM